MSIRRGEQVERIVCSARCTNTGASTRSMDHVFLRRLGVFKKSVSRSCFVWSVFVFSLAFVNKDYFYKRPNACPGANFFTLISLMPYKQADIDLLHDTIKFLQQIWKIFFQFLTNQVLDPKSRPPEGGAKHGEFSSPPVTQKSLKPSVS